MADDKNKFVADDGYSEVPQPVKPINTHNTKAIVQIFII